MRRSSHASPTSSDPQGCCSRNCLAICSGDSGLRATPAVLPAVSLWPPTSPPSAAYARRPARRCALVGPGGDPDRRSSPLPSEMVEVARRNCAAMALQVSPRSEPERISARSAPPTTEPGPAARAAPGKEATVPAPPSPTTTTGSSPWRSIANLSARCQPWWLVPCGVPLTR